MTLYTGWAYLPEEIAKHKPQFIAGSDRSAIRGAGDNAVRLLWDHTRKVIGRDICYTQEIGDCVAVATQTALDYLQCREICDGDREKWTEISSEIIYAGARVNVGRGQLSGDGCVVSWAARAIQDFGTVKRGTYGDVDLSRYSGRVARSLGSRGVGIPKAIIQYSKAHVVEGFEMVESYAEISDLVASGHPVVIGSSQGFSETRDRQGFARPQGRWEHAMCIVGVDNQHERRCVCISNQWGPNWISGPKRHDQPDGTFWVDEEIVDRMLNQGEAFSPRGFKGYGKPSMEMI